MKNYHPATGEAINPSWKVDPRTGNVITSSVAEREEIQETLEKDGDAASLTSASSEDTTNMSKGAYLKFTQDKGMHSYLKAVEDETPYHTGLKYAKYLYEDYPNKLLKEDIQLLEQVVANISKLNFPKKIVVKVY